MDSEGFLEDPMESEGGPSDDLASGESEPHFTRGHRRTDTVGKADDRVRAARMRRLSLFQSITFIGYGKAGYFNPFSYMNLFQPFKSGTVVPQLVLLMFASCITGLIACADPDLWAIGTNAHDVLAFVTGFLLVVLGEFSNKNYEKGIECMNQMVQHGCTCCTDIAGMLPKSDESVSEIVEFRRLILLYFRLCCFEVRSDLAARKNRATWLDPDGNISNVEERELFCRASTRMPEREWDYHYSRPEFFGAVGSAVGYDDIKGTFEIPVRPAMVQVKLMMKINSYFERKWIPNPPTHAKVLSSLNRYCNHLETMLGVDRTPLPFSYVQMTSTLLCVFTLSFPFALVKSCGWGTPFLAMLFSYAYGGLYVNACRLRNPFNFDGGMTGIPINAFIQRLERSTEAVLLGSSKRIGDALTLVGSASFQNSAAASLKKENDKLKREVESLRQVMKMQAGVTKAMNTASVKYKSQPSETWTAKTLDSDMKQEEEEGTEGDGMRRRAAARAPAKLEGIEAAVNGDEDESQSFRRDRFEVASMSA
jgi:hypothetical protein